MTTSRSPAELVALRKAAQELSTQRRERLSTIHLLAVAARGDSPAAELFADRLASMVSAQIETEPTGKIIEGAGG